LDLVIYQIQGNVSLTNMSDPRHLELAVQQIQGNNYPLLAHPRR
jgi:hypothetical protein